MMYICGYYEWITFCGRTENPAGSTGKYVNPFTVQTEDEKYHELDRRSKVLKEKEVELAICVLRIRALWKKYAVSRNRI